MVLVESFHYRPLWGRILAVAVAAVSVTGTGAFIANADLEGLAYSVWFFALFAFAAWAMFWRPELAVEPHGIRVVNVFSTVDVAWPAIERVDTRFALTLHTTDGRIPVWTAPAPGLRGAVGVRHDDLRHLSESTYGAERTARPGDSIGTPSGQASYLIRTRWEDLRDRGMLDRGVEAGSVRTTRHVTTIAVTGVLVAACMVSLGLQLMA